MREQYEYLVSQFDILALIQIIVIALVIYAVLSLTQNTQADILLRGTLAFFALLLLVGKVFQLTLINWILENAAPGMVLVVAVIFAPELRRLLERLGRTGGYIAHPFASLDPTSTEKMIDATTVTSGILSRRSWGGLIVIEREAGLEDIAGTGTRLNAKISPELLLSVFYPNSELHDLAALVRGDDVIAAGCMLPMSEEAARDQHLGSRHRAAVGITEQTDAIAIAVSEETGSISLSADGKLARHLTEEQLRRRLHAIFRPRVDGTRSLPMRMPTWMNRH